MSERAPGQAAISKSAASSDPLIGRMVNDRFKIISLIARGGMGKVYRAEQAPLGRLCAVKVLNPNYAGDQDPEFHKRFFLEASIASKLTHPNTVTIFDYGRTDDDIYYMAMEFLDGVTLHRAIRTTTHLPEERTIHIAMQMCRALREAHTLGVIHRDLKTANIFLVEHGDESDFVKVLDFGLVKELKELKPEDQLTQTGLFMGSPKYMSPEQIQGERVDPRTDIYALGIIMYEMLTGKVPFDRPNSVNILMAHVNEQVPPMRVTYPNLLVSAAMEDTVMRCIAKNPDDRFTTMDDVLASLKMVASAAHPSMFPGSAYGTGQNMAMSSGQYAPVPFDSRPGGPGTTTGGGGTTGSGAINPNASLRPQSHPSGSGAQAIGPSFTSVAPPGADGELPFALQPERRRTRALTAFLLVLVAGLGSALAFMVVTEKTEPIGDARPPASTSSGVGGVGGAGGLAPPGQGALPTPPPIATVSLTIRVSSDPGGANVREDGRELCPATPCDVTYRGDDANPGKEHRLLLIKNGFRPENRTFKAGDPPLQVRLARAPAGSTYVPPPVVKPVESATTPQGFKDIPY
ncbi:MAG: serine/threonine-protein kinase [Polyangiaceae bacterium]